MQLYPFLSPDDAGSDEEKRFTESEIQQLLSEKLAEEKQCYETALQNEAAARLQAEAALHERESELRAHQMRQKAQEELKSRQLPAALISMLNLSSDEALAQTLTAAESAFRAALEEGVRQRLSSQAPSLIPLPQKTHKPKSLSYQEAAANYIRDRHNT